MAGVFTTNTLTIFLKSKQINAIVVVAGWQSREIADNAAENTIGRLEVAVPPPDIQYEEDKTHIWDSVQAFKPWP